MIDRYGSSTQSKTQLADTKIPVPAYAAVPPSHQLNGTAQGDIITINWDMKEKDGKSIRSTVSVPRGTSISQFLEGLSKTQDGLAEAFTSFSFVDGRHRRFSWRGGSLHYQVEVVQTPSEFSRSGNTIKLNETDTFAKCWTRITEAGSPKPELQNGSTIVFGGTGMALTRTLRIPNDGSTYPLPAGLGTFPLYSVANYDLPADVKAKGGLMTAMYQLEALWLSFICSKRPTAIRIFSGGINVLSGKAELSNWTQRHSKNEDVVQQGGTRLIVRKQSWLDGFVSSDSKVRQFVATSLNSGNTVESQITGSNNLSGLQIEFTPSFETNFLAFNGEHRLDPLDTPKSSGLSIGDAVLLASPSECQMPELECRTFKDILGCLTCPVGSPLDIEMHHGLQVYIKTLTGKVILLPILPSDKVGSVEELIYDREGIPRDQQRLIFDGKVLEDGK
ncbi:hypothetical protein FRB93_010547 [Tulasnella sp. JGI-2019a]|nr:hypothetical protein FRB93_010547 [Tulasnella sp. JGI-2019a]